MTARAHLTGPARRPAAGADTRLPWWAVALPAAAFCALLSLLMAGGEADAVQSTEPLSRLLERVRESLHI